MTAFDQSCPPSWDGQHYFGKYPTRAEFARCDFCGRALDCWAWYDKYGAIAYIPLLPTVIVEEPW